MFQAVLALKAKKKRVKQLTKRIIKLREMIYGEDACYNALDMQELDALVAKRDKLSRQVGIIFQENVNNYSRGGKRG